MGKNITRIFKPVSEMSAAEWQILTDTALKVLSTADGLLESIRQRQRIALYFCEGELVGTSTVDVFPCEFQGVKTVAMYTGNGWYHPTLRGRNLTQSLALQCILAARLQYPRHLCYWFFGSGNYKSYLMMIKNFSTFWPRYDQDTPAWDLAYLRFLADQFYHHTWSEGPYGILPSEEERNFLPTDTTIPAELLANPHIQFYQRVNPNYVHGAKLVCGAPFTTANLAIVIGRTLLRAGRRLPWLASHAGD